MNTAIRVDDAGRHQVGWTRNGIDFAAVGTPFAKPRAAIDYSTELEGWGPRSGQDAIPGAEPAVADPGQPEAPGPQVASTSCVACGRGLPPTSRPQRRTCSAACRRALARREARQAAEKDPGAEETGAARSMSQFPAAQSPFLSSPAEIPPDSAGLPSSTPDPTARSAARAHRLRAADRDARSNPISAGPGAVPTLGLL